MASLNCANSSARYSLESFVLCDLDRRRVHLVPRANEKGEHIPFGEIKKSIRFALYHLTASSSDTPKFSSRVIRWRECYSYLEQCGRLVDFVSDEKARHGWIEIQASDQPEREILLELSCDGIWIYFGTNVTNCYLSYSNKKWVLKNRDVCHKGEWQVGSKRKNTCFDVLKAIHQDIGTTYHVVDNNCLLLVHMMRALMKSGNYKEHRRHRQDERNRFTRNMGEISQNMKHSLAYTILSLFLPSSLGRC
eukprot:TRINITY_DN13199_c0_g1_i2.p1 TRINITY_DN13199_c0_g1~~TRINITY_DN13199_c0_g1_i2.p1  ORF type:complete len:267 (-),score=7.15 TRINITY_DN13199_c0_g1_i2:93-839(-)